MVNVNQFFDPCVALLNRAVDERFMNERHRDMWTLVADPESVPEALRSAPEWARDARKFATG
jgi:hypothetical protein